MEVLETFQGFFLFGSAKALMRSMDTTRRGFVSSLFGGNVAAGGSTPEKCTVPKGI